MERFKAPKGSITINYVPPNLKPIDISVPNIPKPNNGVNPVNWTGGNYNPIQTTGNNNFGQPNIPNINIPNISGNDGVSTIGTGSLFGSKTNVKTTSINSNSSGLGKEYHYTEILGTAGDTARNNYGHSAGVGYIIDFCRKQSGDFWGSNALDHGATKLANPVHIKVINLGKTGLDDNDMANLFYVLRDFNFNLDVINVSGNNFGYQGVACMINGISSINKQTLYKNPEWKPYPATFNTVQKVSILNLSNNKNIGDDAAKIISEALITGKLPAKVVDVHDTNITQNGWESFAAAVKKVQANTIVIKVAAADTLQGMKEFLTKGFKYYTQTHKIVVTKEFQDELLGLNTSACEKTKNNVLKAAYTAGFIKSLTNGNDYFILKAGVEAGAGALLSQDTADCYKEIIGGLQELYNGE